MRKIKQVAAVLMLALFLPSVTYAQWVFIAKKGMGLIRQMQSENTDVAAVLLQAKADNVYNTAVKTIQANPNLHIIKRSDADRTIGFTDGERIVNMKVTSLDDKVSDLLISSNVSSGKPGATSLVVENVLRICKEMKVQCSPEKK